jgi:hypothetical protein
MIGRKSIVGLSLFSALLFCAFAAQSASAAWPNAKNLTAYTCTNEGEHTADFSDPHCDKSVTPGTGEYGHIVIPVGQTTEIETSNILTGEEREAAVLETTVLLNKVKISCSKVTPDTATTSWIKNVGSGTEHQVEGTSAVEFSECVTTGNGTGCTVNEPITLPTFFHGVENEGKMALEFTPDPAGGAYLTLKFTGAKCVVKEAEVTGSARGTGASVSGGGATLEFKGADEELTFKGGTNTSFTAKFTTKMAGVNGKAITITTPTG